MREALPRRLVRIGVKRPRLVLLFWFAVAMVATPTLLRVQVEASAESVLDKGDPAWATYQESLGLFGGDEIVVVAFETEDAFSEPMLREIERLSDLFEDLPGVRRVDSVSTQPVIFVNASSTLELNPPLPSGGAIDSTTSSRARSLAKHDRIIRGNLVDAAERTMAINLVLESNPARHYPELLETVRSATANTDGSIPNAWVSGVPVFQQETSEQTRSELLTFAPLAVLAVALLIIVVYRSVPAAVGVVGVGTVANLLMLSAIGLAGVPMSFTMVILPPLVVALAAAYGMHVLTAASRVSAQPENRDEWTSETTSSISQVASPVALSGLTTTIGFLASSLTGVDAVRYVGTFGAIGVLATTSLTLTFLPAVLAMSSRPIRRARGLEVLAESAAPRLAQVATRSSAATILTWSIAAAIASIGIQLVHVDTDATRWFETGTRTRDDYERIRSALAGISPINVVVESEPEDTVLAAATIESISRLAQTLEALPEVGKVVSIADPLIQIHEGFSDGATPSLPADALAEQYLLLLESVDQIDDLISADRTAANLLVRVDNNGSAQILQVARFAEEWWRSNGPEGTAATSTGVMFEFARAQDSIAWGQLVGLAAALAAIAVILVATFRTAALAVATFLPNAVPLLFIYGAMGTLGIPLDAGTVLVGSLALGIAVDDTIHVTWAFVEGTSSDGHRSSLSAALSHSLPAITYTTFVVGAAFVLLALSDFTFVRNLGLLMASVMTVCLIADISLLPALLARLSSRKDKERPSGK